MQRAGLGSWLDVGAEMGEMPRLLACAVEPSEMEWVEQVWKRRHVQVGRQLGSHMSLRSLGDIPVEMPRV